MRVFPLSLTDNIKKVVLLSIILHYNFFLRSIFLHPQPPTLEKIYMTFKNIIERFCMGIRSDKKLCVSCPYHQISVKEHDKCCK